MPKAIAVIETNIHCDTCHYQFAGSVEEWHGKSCPKCGAPDIINDKDLMVWKLFHEAATNINDIVGDVDDDFAQAISISIDTAPLRNKP